MEFYFISMERHIYGDIIHRLMISKPINNLIAVVCEMHNMKTHNIFV